MINDDFINFAKQEIDKTEVFGETTDIDTRKDIVLNILKKFNSLPADDQFILIKRAVKKNVIIVEEHEEKERITLKYWLIRWSLIAFYGFALVTLIAFFIAYVLGSGNLNNFVDIIHSIFYKIKFILNM